MGVSPARRARVYDLFSPMQRSALPRRSSPASPDAWRHSVSALRCPASLLDSRTACALDTVASVLLKGYVVRLVFISRYRARKGRARCLCLMGFPSDGKKPRSVKILDSGCCPVALDELLLFALASGLCFCLSVLLAKLNVHVFSCYT